MLRRGTILIVVSAVTLTHCGFLLAGFLAPYPPTEQHREYAYAPPTCLHFADASGQLHFRPFVYRLVAVNSDEITYREDRSRAYPIYIFRSTSTGLHLFAVDDPAHAFLLGTDGYGRDIFSRVLFGGRTSFIAAVLATLLSLALGASLGAVAGHFAGGAADAVIMRASELALCVPWIYLLLGIRAALPLHISATQAFFLFSALLGVIGWARPARLIRGVVLSAKERPFVTAARGFGASDWYLLRRHVLPQTVGILLTQGVILVPQFITAEATLSFLGLGMAEPMPSLGNMLSVFQQFHTISYWWMATPIVCLVVVCFTYFAVADVLHKIGARLTTGQSYA